jgi:hypothetical protein
MIKLLFFATLKNITWQNIVDFSNFVLAKNKMGVTFARKRNDVMMVESQCRHGVMLAFSRLHRCFVHANLNISTGFSCALECARASTLSVKDLDERGGTVHVL